MSVERWLAQRRGVVGMLRAVQAVAPAQATATRAANLHTAARLPDGGCVLGDCMKETSKDVVLVEASKPTNTKPDVPRNAQQELVGILFGRAGPTHAGLSVSVG